MYLLVAHVFQVAILYLLGANNGLMVERIYSCKNIHTEKETLHFIYESQIFGENNYFLFR